jgi:hypothetical protein
MTKKMDTHSYTCSSVHKAVFFRYCGLSVIPEHVTGRFFKFIVTARGDRLQAALMGYENNQVAPVKTLAKIRDHLKWEMMIILKNQEGKHE